MIKVCHVTSAHGPEDIRIFHKECCSLVEAGYEVYLVEHGTSYEKNGVHIIGLGEMPASRKKRMTEGARRAYETALSLDCQLYHLHDPELLPYALKLIRKGKKVVFDSHELTRDQIRIKPYLPRPVRAVASAIYSLVENSILKRIDGVIFPCPVDGDFPLPGKCRTYLNNVPMLKEMYERYDPCCHKDADSVCTIGSLTYERGIKHLVEASKRAGCNLILAGSLTPKDFENEILNATKNQQVELLGYLNRDQVVETINRSLVGVSAVLNIGQYSRTENLSTKVYEYMSLGVPVILSDQPFNRKMIDSYHFGLCVDPENLDEFAKAIRYLLDHPDEAKEMGQKGRKAIKERFNWEIERNNLYKLYETIMNS